MTTDCKELRSLLTVLASKIDETTGKLDSQEIGNALYGLQGLSSQMVGARLIAGMYICIIYTYICVYVYLGIRVFICLCIYVCVYIYI
jgi:hypothetical protein